MRAQARLLLAQADPRSADSLFRATAAAVKHGLETEALPLLEAGTRTHAADARMWQMLGLAWRKLEEPGPALKALARAAQLAPSDALIAHTLARATLEAGLPASELFRRAQQLAPHDGSVLLGLAAALFAEGGIDRAIALLDDRLRQQPGWFAGHGTACRLRWMQGDRDGFTASFERALAGAPREVELWRALIITILDARLVDRAIATIARARAAAGPNPAFDALEAACAGELGETERADRLYAALGPLTDMTLAIRYVRHLLRSGRPVEAARFAEARRQDDPEDLLWPYLASAWRLTGDSRWQWLEGDPRFVGVYDIADELPSLDALARCLRGLHLATHQPLEQSVRGGTQTDGPLFARLEPEIRALRKAIKAAVERHVAQLPGHDPGHPLLRHPRGPVRFAGSWSVRLAGAGFHSNHVHPAGWISSALYVTLPEAAMGGEGSAGWLSLGEATELGLDLPPFRLVEPKPGRLVLFPSTMWHGTRPFAEGERLTVAFDVARPVV